MHNIAKSPANQRYELFRGTADAMNVPEAIVEKDFWVCWILDYLFHRCPWKKNLAFKGGTSLSKSYSVIERFSEDIDLILDWRLLDYSENEPWANRSKNQQNIFNREIENHTIEFLTEIFIPTIKSDLENELDMTIKIYKNEAEPQTVNFEYPRIYSEKSILDEIKLEIGALALWTPSKNTLVSPYCAQKYTSLFQRPMTEILTVSSERTFWEKITILHHEANRPQTTMSPKRYSRHYYDVYCMSKSFVKESAFHQIELLDQVSRFKDKFYHQSWAHYEEAKIGTLKLIPSKKHEEKLREDYKNMQNMIFGSYKPTFDEIMDEIKKLEIEINRL